jgi:hypothetical protein
MHKNVKLQTLEGYNFQNNDSANIILAVAKRNDGFLSDDAQNLLTQLLINHLFQDKSK